MKKIINYIAFIGISTLLFFSCKSELDVQNPNQPTPSSASTEAGLISLAQGGVYVNGFTSTGNKYYDAVIGEFFNGVYGIHEMMGDVIAAEAANAYMNQISCPNEVTLDDGTKVLNPNNPNKFYDFIRSVNVNANQGGNPGFHEWAFMYGLNNSCNTILSLIDNVSFSGDATVKKNTLKAWAYWWKGFAYSRIGSIYYAGIINNEVNKTNGIYVTKEKIIEESNANLDKASALLNGITSLTGYNSIMTTLIPDYFQKEKGGVMSPAVWVKNINTLKARNILVNTSTAQMTTAQWQSILALTNAGIGKDDIVFTGRAKGDIFVPANYNVASRCVGANASGGTFKISERFIQDFNLGDKRLQNNFKQFTPWIGNSDRGNSFNTRWGIIDKGAGLAGVLVYTNRDADAGELYMAGTYEENELMKAEALLNTGNLTSSAQAIDNVRLYQGSGLATTPTASVDALKEELRRERRVSLAFRGLSFYDARRWGVIETGRRGAVVLSKNGVVSTNATINYGYLDYWDVPDNELAYNKPATGSAVVVNPKK